MKNWKKAAVSPGATIRDTLRVIDRSVTQVALVVDAEGRLAGTVTDGDVRRGLLRGLTLDHPIELVANVNPIVMHAGEDASTIQRIMHERSVNQIPLIDDDGRVVSLELLKEYLSTPRHDNFVVLMAGGLGTRLRPLTETCPKPLLQIGGKPLLEIILESFKTQGFRRFAFAVNYMADMIEDHFGDGSSWGVKISYLREPSRLGTAGALRLLPEAPDKPFIVMNGDLLTKVNFGHLLDYHTEFKARATICVREYDVKVPFGIVEVQENRLVALQEKPVQKFFVNAGIYVLEPEVIEHIPREIPYDMTTVFEDMAARGERPAVFPVREYWLDIGQIDDYQQALEDFDRKPSRGSND